ncbi:hypothetical protein ACK2HE_12440 [Escherichia coli]|uniref:hypothetical protein n=1 Tax=Escherichia coli TaxID=562 RepID=UPI003909B70F
MMKEVNTMIQPLPHFVAEAINQEKPEILRIPLYSITDWHRSPISDSHPFDQPGT